MSKLSKRQAQIFRHLEKGHTLKHIAEQVGISPNTVKNHCAALRKKLGDAPSTRVAIYNFYRPSFRGE